MGDKRQSNPSHLILKLNLQGLSLLTPYEYFGKIERNFFQLKSQVNEGWDKPSSQKIEMTDICSRRGEYNEVF